MTAPAPAAPLGGKYLTFGLGDEEYGVAVLKVREIIGMQPVTRVPRTPAFIRGVINLRGAVIPVMDLRERFGMPPAGAEAPAELRCIVVTQVAGPTAGPS
jgi:purine-binding chemotaxis protein CheW